MRFAIKNSKIIKFGAIFGCSIALASQISKFSKADQFIDFKKFQSQIGSKREEISQEQIKDKYKKFYKTPDLDAILDKNSKKHVINSKTIISCESSQYNANKQIEDTFAVENLSKGAIFGVFDGHSGTAASKFCSSHLFSLLRYFKKVNNSEELLTKNAFVFADDCFLTLAEKENRISDATSGACAVVAHVENDKITVANAGDCRCVLGIKDSQTGKYLACDLSKDHQIHVNAEERSRLIENHPREVDIVWRSRVRGFLQPTRGFGDGIYKRMSIFKKTNIKRNVPSWNPPYTTAEPEITQTTLSETDSFIVMATDGIFDNLSSQEVVDCVSEVKETGEEMNSAARVIKKSLIAALMHRREYAGDGRDINLMLNTPPGSRRRRLHDDMTVLVVKLNKNNSAENKKLDLNDTFKEEKEPIIIQKLREHFK